MIIPGASSKVSVSHEQIADATVRVLRRTVPAAVPGIVFLSGGQKPKEATSRLNAMNKLPKQPWRLTFSFSRALQGPVLKAWGGDNKKSKEAQQLFLHRVRCAALASQGTYNENVENEI
jgi:fructose-bisphosphate aldolase class I